METFSKKTLQKPSWRARFSVTVGSGVVRRYALVRCVSFCFKKHRYKPCINCKSL